LVREQRTTEDGTWGLVRNLTALAKVQRLQTALHTKAKEAPGLRFYSLSDKVWREDVLAVAWQMVRRNGGLLVLTVRQWRTLRRSGWIDGWECWRGT
jgi:hypothetical protein